MNESIHIFARTLANDLIEFTPIINDHLKKIYNRIKKLIKSKENPLLKKFVIWQKGHQQEQ